MTTTHPQVAGAFLVGGIDAADAETAMRTVCRHLGDHIDAVTGGETTLGRNQWIFSQVAVLLSILGINIAPDKRSMPAPGYAGIPVLTIARSVTALPPRCLGYATAAMEEYFIFLRLREEGVIAPDVKFKVCLPTPYATVVTFVAEEDQERFFSVYEAAMANEVDAITSFVASEDLVIQFDIAVEVGVLTGAFTAAPALSERTFIVSALRCALLMPPRGIKRGGHWCYGDLGHMHFAEPADLALCVGLANDVSDVVDFVQMPADRNTGRRPEYYEPARWLKVRELILGVVDYEGDEARTAELIEAAMTGLGPDRQFAISTECGMSRIKERGAGPSLEELLAQHAKFAAPIR